MNGHRMKSFWVVMNPVYAGAYAAIFPDAPAVQELATRLKKTCGAGGAVKEGTIEIQGDHRDRLVAELCKLGYDAKRSGG